MSPTEARVPTPLCRILREIKEQREIKSSGDEDGERDTERDGHRETEKSGERKTRMQKKETKEALHNSSIFDMKVAVHPHLLRRRRPHLMHRPLILGGANPAALLAPR